MASRPALDVWLYDTLIGTLSEPTYGKLRLDYSPEAEARFRPGSIVLSTSMPVNADRRPRGDVVRAFFDGLLPEGDARGALSDEFSVRRGDHFGLLSAIGRDCAGAIVLVPAGTPAREPDSRVEPLSELALEDLIAHLRERPLGADIDVRVSLPGAQEKLLLAIAPDGSWGRPLGGAPSTHILKPQDMRFGSYAAAEAFCLDLGRKLDLTDVGSYVVEIAGRPVIVVSRYDRRRAQTGVVRVHQEDVCQALGIDCSDQPRRKYQSNGGPSLAAFARVLAEFAPIKDRSKLLALTTLNVAVGNADAHAKNISIIHDEAGAVRLAPAYDVTPTTFYTNIPTPDGLKDMTDKLGMWVNGKRSVHDVSAEDLVGEGTVWGLPESTASHVVSSTLEGIHRHIPAAAKSAKIPEAMVDFVASRTAALVAGKSPPLAVR